MIDTTESRQTLPASANVAYGFINGAIVLPVLGASLAIGDDGGKLKTELLGLPVGAVITDGVKRVVIASTSQAVDVSGWNLAKLVLTPPRNFTGSINLQISATSFHSENGSTATTMRELAVVVLNSPGCATPVGGNP
ncbi:hypothetical protein [Massilia sp. S19_KUP03_FR1]|uniref:hypothetical protein n=1 Tax=Massilia sp. S19_KUP03_FR1 TaxID=3025503 RepID=UPI002FCDAD0C